MERRESFVCHSGAARSAEPGIHIHKHCRISSVKFFKYTGVMDSRLAALRRPGMTELRGDVRQFPVAVQGLVRDKRERGGEEFGAGLRGSRGAGEMAPVSARAGHGVEQAV